MKADDIAPAALEAAPGLMEDFKAMMGTVSGRRKLRARAIARSFTRFYAHKPMVLLGSGETARNVQLDARAEWDDGMKSWGDGWAKAREDSITVRSGRRAAKAERLGLWRRKRAVLVAEKRARRRAEAIAKAAALFNAVLADIAR